MNANRHIAGLLLFCFSALLGHNLVPHNHHSGVLSGPMATACPIEHGNHHGHNHDGDQSKDTEKQPDHCHAFNDVVFKNYSPSLNQTRTVPLLALIILRKAYVPEIPQVRLSRSYTPLKAPGSSPAEMGTRALRAPPSMA
ncbi:MAG: hypothetical protein P1P86_01410 [Bacteroidales bacterium]|nr:hypothetical protein [Bacteroidales bacterium]